MAVFERLLSREGNQTRGYGVESQGPRSTIMYYTCTEGPKGAEPLSWHPLASLSVVARYHNDTLYLVGEA